MTSGEQESTVLWIDPSFGASGDMLLGMFAGLIDDPASALKPLSRLGLDGFRVSFDATVRGGLSSTRAMVVTDEQHHHRRWSDIDHLLAESDLPPRSADGARRTFRLLGEVEARQHDVPIDEVHFHEVGALDAIVDIVGVWLMVEALRERSDSNLSVVVGPIGLGHGMVKAAHGLLPLPAPATVALLRGRSTRSLDVEMETCTPTGAALLVALADGWGSLPSGVLGATSRGAGGKNPSGHPNVVSAVLVAPADASMQNSSVPWSDQVATMLETNLDDVTPEVLGFVIETLMAAGADDAWIIPIIMKKGRPAHELRVLCGPGIADDLTALIMRGTGTLGVRRRTITKHVAPRSNRTVMLDGHEVRVKIGPHGAKPEHDDLVRAAVSTGRSLRQLALDAIALLAADDQDD